MYRALVVGSFLVFAACGGGSNHKPPAGPAPTAFDSVAAASGSMSSPRFRLTFELGATRNTTPLVVRGK